MSNIGLHDIVEVNFSDLTSLSGRYRVLPSGQITIPNLGSIAVVTRSEEQIKSLLLKRITETFGISDNCTISVTRDKLSGIRVGGSVVKPLVISHATNLSFGELLKSLQLTDSADSDSAIPTTFQGFPITLAGKIKPGDQLNVPQRVSGGQVFVLGGVKSPSTIPFVKGMTLGSVIDFCGGLTPRAKPDRIFIQRQTEVGPLDLFKNKDVPIQRGDSIRVELNTDVKYVTVTGNIRIPSNIEWVAGITLKQALIVAGGVLDKKCTIEVRSLSDSKKKSYKVKWADLQKDPSKDVKLLPGDVVDVVAR